MQVHADIDTVKVVVKNVPDYAAGKEKNDLGFLTFDLQVDKIKRPNILVLYYYKSLPRLTSTPSSTGTSNSCSSI